MSHGNARYYNTGKVLIGIAYQKPLPQLTQEGEFIQAVLLGQRPATYWSRRRVVINTVLWTAAVFVILVVAKLVAGK